MNKSDIEEFTETILPVYELYDKDLSDGAIRIMFALLEPYPILDIKKAMADHMREGKFAPKPADIIAQIEKANHDGRLESDEAWAIALNSFDERQTIALNDEIASALNLARSIYADGDKVGARMAFKKSYEREVEKARAIGKPVKWWPSLGHDPDGREAGIQQAINQGYLPASSIEIIGIPYKPDNPLLEVAKKGLAKP